MMLEALHTATQETVTLSMQNGLQMEFVRVIVGKFPIALQMKEGDQVPLFGTAVGTAALSTKEDKIVHELYERAALIHDGNHSPLALKEVMREVKLARERGYAIVYEGVLPDSGAIACPIYLSGREHTLIIAAGGPTQRITQSESAMASELFRLQNQHRWREKNLNRVS